MNLPKNLDWQPREQVLQIHTAKDRMCRGAWAPSVAGAKAALAVMRKFKSSRLDLCRDYVDRRIWYLHKRVLEREFDRAAGIRFLKDAIARAA